MCTIKAILSVALFTATACQTLAEGCVSLDSCRTLALSNNKQLQIRSEAIRKSRYQKKEALAAYLPAIDFNGGYTYNQKNLSLFNKDQLLPTKTFDPATQSYQFNIVKNPVTGEPVTGPDGQFIPETVALIPKDAMTYDMHNLFFGAVTLTQPIYMGGKIIAMNKLTKFAENAARALRNAEAENVICVVDAAYWQVVSLKAKHKLALSYLNLLDTLYQNVDLMVTQGVATKSDRLSVEVKRNQANVDLTKVENGVTLARMALAQVCGLPIDTYLHLADEDINLTSDMLLDTANQRYNINDIYNRRQDLQAMRMGIEALRQKERISRSDMLPKVAIVGAYSFSNPNIFDGFSKRFDGTFSIGAMVSIPVWHWGGNYNKYRAAQSETRIAELSYNDTKDLVNLQVRQSAFKAQEAVKTYQMTKSNLDKAADNLRQANLGFREGIMTTDNVMEAQTAWLKAHSENIDAMIDIRLCNVYLSKALGTLPLPKNN